MSGPESTDSVEYLELADLIRLAEGLFGDPAPISDVGLLGAAALRPAVSLSGQEVYPDLFTKAAALMDSLVRGRSLEHANRRFAWFATNVFLEINEVATKTPDVDAVVALLEEVELGHHNDMVEVAGRLRVLVQG